MKGQLVSGGWDYNIEFDPAKRHEWAYRVDVADTGTVGDARNVSTLDDQTTQSALRLLMRTAAATEDPVIDAATEYGLEAFARAQFPNGAWPQRYTSGGASGDWGYSQFYTFNDATINDCIDVMLEAWKLRGDERWRESALAGADFIIASQLPAPQEGWAQQYNHDLQPAKARSFEPRGVCSSVTRRNIRTLIEVYLATGDEQYLEPIPSALDWLERSVVDIPALYFEVRERIRSNAGGPGSTNSVRIRRSSVTATAKFTTPSPRSAKNDSAGIVGIPHTPIMNARCMRTLSPGNGMRFWPNARSVNPRPEMLWSGNARDWKKISGVSWNLWMKRGDGWTMKAGSGCGYTTGTSARWHDTPGSRGKTEEPAIDYDGRLSIPVLGAKRSAEIWTASSPLGDVMRKLLHCLGT